MKHKQYSHDNHILCRWSFTVLKYTSAALCRRKSSQEWVSLQDMSGPVRTKRESTISTHIFTLKRIFPSFSNFPSWWLNQPHLKKNNKPINLFVKFDHFPHGSGNETLNKHIWVATHLVSVLILHLVGGFTPFWKICSSNWIISPRIRGEHKKIFETTTT